MKKIYIDYEKLKGALAGQQNEIARKLGWSQGKVSYKVNQRRKLTLEELNEIAEALGRDTSDFLELEGQIIQDIKKAA